MSQVYLSAKQWISPSVKSHSNQQVSLANIKPFASCDAVLLFNVLPLLFCVLLIVVGVKLNVSFWMNSFMNATLKVNVSYLEKVYFYCVLGPDRNGIFGADAGTDIRVQEIR